MLDLQLVEDIALNQPSPLPRPLTPLRPPMKNSCSFRNRKMPVSFVQHDDARLHPSTPFLGGKPLNAPRSCAPDPRQRSPHIDWWSATQESQTAQPRALAKVARRPSSLRSNPCATCTYLSSPDSPSSRFQLHLGIWMHCEIRPKITILIQLT